MPGEVAGHPLEKVPVHDAVGVDGHDKLAGGHGQAGVQGTCLAAVGDLPVEDRWLARARRRRMRGEERLDDLVRAVGRAVVDDDDLEVAIAGRHHRAQRGQDAHLLVPGGHEYRDPGRVIACAIRHRMPPAIPWRHRQLHDELDQDGQEQEEDHEPDGPEGGDEMMRA